MVKIGKKNKDMAFLLAHEIGHAGFGLQHPFENDTKDENVQGYKQGDDPYNFMDYYKGRTSRAYQWDLIFKNDKIKNKQNEKSTTSKVNKN